MLVSPFRKIFRMVNYIIRREKESTIRWGYTFGTMQTILVRSWRQVLLLECRHILPDSGRYYFGKLKCENKRNEEIELISGTENDIEYDGYNFAHKSRCSWNGVKNTGIVIR